MKNQSLLNEHRIASTCHIVHDKLSANAVDRSLSGLHSLDRSGEPNLGSKLELLTSRLQEAVRRRASLCSKQRDRLSASMADRSNSDSLRRMFKTRTLNKLFKTMAGH